MIADNHSGMPNFTAKVFTNRSCLASADQADFDANALALASMSEWDAIELVSTQQLEAAGFSDTLKVPKKVFTRPHNTRH